MARPRVIKPTRKVMEGSPLSYNVPAQMRYANALTTLIEQMAEAVVRQVKTLFNTPDAREFYEEQAESAAFDTARVVATMDDSLASQARIRTNAFTKKYEKIFAEKARKLAERMLKSMDKTSAENLKSSLKKISGEVAIKTNFKTNGLREILKAATTENVALIESIGSQYLGNVQKAVMRSITTERGLPGLVKDLSKYEGISKRHAKNMALDQTRKAYNVMNKERSQALGVKQFKWIHSGGGQRPRDSHIKLSGEIYYFDKNIPPEKGGLPVINQEQVDKGYEAPERGIPGQAINCKCKMAPVIDFSFGGDDE